MCVRTSIRIQNFFGSKHQPILLLTLLILAASPQLQNNTNCCCVLTIHLLHLICNSRLNLGADIVMHSSTKYLGGHSDVIQGALVMNDKELREKLYFIQKSCGAIPGPMDCFLVLRGIKTLHIRMQRHCENGEKIAHYLRNHSKEAR